MDTPNSEAAPAAMPSASTSTVNVNSSRDLVPATRSSSAGMRRSAIAATATRPASFTAVNARFSAMRPGVASATNTEGSRTSPMTVRRSSTTSQPTAMRPADVCRSRLSDRRRMRTTVLATDSDMPNTIAAGHANPIACDVVAPSTVMAPLAMTAPGTAMRRTSSSSSTLNCRPTPNMIRMMPISESCSANSWLATSPGVFGPTRTPASRYPTMGDSPIRWVT